MAKQRNNIAKLAAEARMRICELLDDGASYDEIRADKAVLAACEIRNVAIHNTSLLAYRESSEFKEYCEIRRKWSDEFRRRKMAAMIVETEKGSDSIAKVANFELLNIVIRKLQSGEELEAKELSSISGALAAYERNRISQAKEDARRDFARQEAEYQAEIARLSAKIAELAEGSAGRSGISPETLSVIEEKIRTL